MAKKKQPPPMLFGTESPSDWLRVSEHLIAAIASPHTPESLRLAIVGDVMADTIRYLESVEEGNAFISPPNDPNRPNLREPQWAIKYCGHFRQSYKGRELAALILLRRCAKVTQQGAMRLDDIAAFSAELMAVGTSDPRARSASNADNAKRPRKSEEARDSDAELVCEFDRLVREGHTPGEARGILTRRGSYGSKTTVWRKTT